MSWFSLPTEMHLAIVDVLDNDGVKALSTVDRTTYDACVPSLFKVRYYLFYQIVLLIYCSSRSH